MKEVTITFKTDEDGTFPEDKLMLTMKGLDMHLALWDISQDIFRPARQHGYHDIALNSLVDDNVVEVLALLEQKFFSILSSRGIELW